MSFRVVIYYLLSQKHRDLTSDSKYVIFISICNIIALIVNFFYIEGKQEARAPVKMLTFPDWTLPRRALLLKTFSMAANSTINRT